jgi:hypothetical protein
MPLQVKVRHGSLSRALLIIPQQSHQPLRLLQDVCKLCLHVRAQSIDVTLPVSHEPIVLSRPFLLQTPGVHEHDQPLRDFVLFFRSVAESLRRLVWGFSVPLNQLEIVQQRCVAQGIDEERTVR